MAGGNNNLGLLLEKFRPGVARGEGKCNDPGDGRHRKLEHRRALGSRRLAEQKSCLDAWMLGTAAVDSPQKKKRERVDDRRGDRTAAGWRMGEVVTIQGSRSGSIRGRINPHAPRSGLR